MTKKRDIMRDLIFRIKEYIDMYKTEITNPDHLTTLINLFDGIMVLPLNVIIGTYMDCGAIACNKIRIEYFKDINMIFIYLYLDKQQIYMLKLQD